jgi:FkbM family methyltransferase
MKSTFNATSDLVFDLGMNNGDDTEYYLKKGYRVIAVEANPILCTKAEKQFHVEVSSGKLTILNVAISTSFDKRSFFVNLDNDLWSSLDTGWAGRENSAYEEISVDCVPLDDLFSKFGTPYYLKIDVEGADEMVIDQLSEQSQLPYFMSVEDCRFGYRYMSMMNELGYSGYKLIDQSYVHEITDDAVYHKFKEGSSGPFGGELNGTWLPYEAIEEKYSIEVRDRQLNRLAPRTHWWDIHCKGPDIGS